MVISEWFPVGFGALAMAHFFALLSPGPDFWLITAQSARYGFASARWICLGVAIGNGIYIALVMAGWNLINTIPSVFLLIQLLGVAYLLWLGWQLLTVKGEPLAIEFDQATQPVAHKQLVKGVMSALLNPKNMLFYGSLLTVMLGEAVSAKHQAVTATWLVSMVLLWDLLIAFLMGSTSFRTAFGDKRMYVDKAAGFMLILMGIGLALQRF